MRVCVRVCVSDGTHIAYDVYAPQVLMAVSSSPSSYSFLFWECEGTLLQNVRAYED